MGIADDFMNAFFKEHPEASEGKLTLPELNKLLAQFQDSTNNASNDDFDGLSPVQMDVLLRQPFSANSIIGFNPSMNEHLDQVPLFQLSKMLLDEIRASGNVKLTSKGNLPVRICKLLNDQQLIRWEYMEFSTQFRQDDIPYILSLKQYLLDAGLVKKQHNSLSLTKKGAEFQHQDISERFKSLFFFFTGRFHWGNLYRIEDDGKYGHLGWAYSLLLLSKYGSLERDSIFYSQKLMQAFEKENSRMFHFAYEVRFFDCFANWFGLVDAHRVRDRSVSFSAQVMVRKSALFDKLFIMGH